MSEVKQQVHESLLGSAIHNIRKQQGLTQGEVAELVGISVSQLSRIETGQRRAKAEIMTKLGQVLGKEIETIAEIETISNFSNKEITLNYGVEIGRAVDTIARIEETNVGNLVLEGLSMVINQRRSDPEFIAALTDYLLPEQDTSPTSQD